MFRKSLVWVMVLGIVLVISSGALAKSNFFGIQILDLSKAQEAFSKVVRTKTGISYTYKSKLTNDSVYCWSTAENYWITFQIHNNSKGPIQMNYFMDKYELASVDGNIYELELPDILDYPSKVINPKESRKIKVSNPLKNLTEVKYLSVSLSWGEVFIFLRRIEEQQVGVQQIDLDIFDIDEILGKTISGIRDNLGEPLSDWQPTKSQLKLDPDWSSFAIWKIKDFEIQVDYYENEPVEHIFIANIGTTYSQNELIKMFNLSLNSLKYKIKAVKAAKGTGITGLNLWLMKTE